MKRFAILLLLIANTILVSPALAQTTLKVISPPKDIIKDVNAVLRYYQSSLRFDGDVLAYDVKGKPITKSALLKAVSTGNYLPLKVSTNKALNEYQLYDMRGKAGEDVKSMVKQIGRTCYGKDQLMNKKFPAFKYVDLAGKTYTQQNTKGKILVLKAWFISCVPCVAEMPELNKLTEEFKDRKDIVFVSMAFDSRAALKKFMKTKDFKYAVVPVTTSYLQDDLHITGYPAHFVINKQGVLVSMGYDRRDMMTALYREAAKKI
ncbi:TlpA family protein disulfide reductase [Mucilaginibacter myungsuensis]|uniref:TlpA family protein disulfide reductase n=1 Tax=Mucilaginibacter myungsuensis TaxID=649104 RepID=A0A929L1N5_9SPHI|nr:TlpA disulfide reductase family protein [Mucilaginibacter myungsuensis]MBE9664562.1 TlpA family protein disulfide reductase [Mucilaginibacter myungsuensis]MDN3601088.1 TlpA disulfide reductase family protein [Mucilaginibacter myungsuensis]